MVERNWCAIGGRKIVEMDDEGVSIKYVAMMNRPQEVEVEVVSETNERKGEE